MKMEIEDRDREIGVCVHGVRIRTNYSKCGTKRGRGSGDEFSCVGNGVEVGGC